MCEPGLHVVVFKELIKLCLHSLDIKELYVIVITFLKENKLPSFVLCISFEFVPVTEQRLLGFSLHFQRKK